MTERDKFMAWLKSLPIWKKQTASEMAARWQANLKNAAERYRKGIMGYK